MSKILKKKYQLILTQEHKIARSAALQVLKPKPFSVWEVLIPIVFILGYMRSKEQRELFIQNLLFTKKLALGAALDMAKNHLTKQDVLEKIDKETKAVIASVDQRIYSENIRICQMGEIDLLIDHFQKLLDVDGENYSDLIINAYQTRDNYAEFMRRLQAAEKKVTKAACETLGDKADAATLSRLESAIESIRHKEADALFGTNQKPDVK